LKDSRAYNADVGLLCYLEGGYFCVGGWATRDAFLVIWRGGFMLFPDFSDISNVVCGCKVKICGEYPEIDVSGDGCLLEVMPEQRLEVGGE
jgi:hypothetical protein